MVAVLVGSLLVSSGVVSGVDAGTAHAAATPVSHLPSPGVLASPVAPPACPPTSSLCNPEGLAVLAALEGTIVVTGAVTTVGLTAGSLTVGSGSAGSGVETLSMPLVQEGWVPSSIVNRKLNPARPPWQQYPNSTAKTSFTVDGPEWGATSGEISVDWLVMWAGQWTSWNESGQVGLRVKCRNGNTWGWTTDVGAYRGEHPGGPGAKGYKGNGTYQPLGAPPSSLCPTARNGFDRIEAVDGYDSTVLATYYPLGHPERPEPVSSGLGTITRWVDCVDGNGVRTKIFDLWTVDLAVGGTFELPALTCPAGSKLDRTGTDWSPQADPSVTDVVVPAVLDPSGVMANPEDYPECFTAGASCRLDLWDHTGATIRWCGFLAGDCPYWYVDPLRAAHYECRWGPYAVDLSICSMFRDPGRILPNAMVDAQGVARFLGFVDLTLDTWVVDRLVEELTDRYGTQQYRCAALGEAVRDRRTVLTDNINIPDVVWDCTEHGIKDALYYIVATSGDVTGSDIVTAIAALAAAALFAPPPVITRPDCDQVTNGTCTDTKPSVTVGLQEWATGPKGGADPQQATTAVQTCTSLVRAANPALSITQAERKCESTPIFVPGGMAGAGKEAAAHDLDVITTYPSLVQLQYVSNKEKRATDTRGWYYSKHAGYLQPCTNKVKEYKTECDEYPYYSSVEGGKAAYSTYGQIVLEPIGWRDNRIEGAALVRMYKDPRCKMTSATLDGASGAVVTPGSPYLVVPLPQVDVASFYLCPKS